MVAHILILANPYFTQTDAEGRFVIPDAPMGAATVRIWYPQSRTRPERPIIITDRGVQDLDFRLMEDVWFSLQEDTITVQHQNKWGQDYPTKY